MKDLNRAIRKLEDELRILDSSKKKLLSLLKKKQISSEEYDFHKKLDDDKKLLYRREIEQRLDIAKQRRLEAKAELSYQERKPATAMFAIILMFSIFALLGTYGGITGFSTFTSEETFVIDANMMFNENGYIDLNFTNATSIRLTGQVFGEGRAKVILEIGDNEFIVIDKTTFREEEDIGNLITGFVVDEQIELNTIGNVTSNETIDDNSNIIIEENVSDNLSEDVTDITENNTPTINESDNNITINNTDSNISINVTNNSSQNSVNNATNIIQNVTQNVTINNSQNIKVNSSENITINASSNETSNISTNITSNVTYNTSQNISENLTINTTENITINTTTNLTENLSANISENISVNGTINITQNITQNISENITENITINATENVTLNITYNPVITNFTNDCIETCILDIPGGRLRIELENVNLSIEKIIYRKEIDNEPPVQIKIIENASFFTEYEIDASTYFTDTDDLIYDVKQTPGLNTGVNGSIISFQTNNSGIFDTFIYVTDGVSLVKSNTFTLTSGIELNITKNVTAEITNITQQRAIVGQPVKWQKVVKANETGDETVVKIFEGAQNIVVKTGQEFRENISEDKLSVVDNKTRKKVKQYEVEQQIKDLSKKLNKTKDNDKKKLIVKTSETELETQISELKNNLAIITGEVVASEPGFLTRWLERSAEFLRNAQITGNVISEIPEAELVNESINETDNETIDEIVEEVIVEVIEEVVENITINDTIIEVENTIINVSENSSEENISSAELNLTENITINISENITTNISENTSEIINSTTNETENTTEESTEVPETVEEISEETVDQTTQEEVEDVAEETIEEITQEEMLNVGETNEQVFANETDDTPTIDLIIGGNETEYIIEYETPAPELYEEQVNNYTKFITISSPYHYERVLTFTNITPSKSEKVKLYWLINGTRTEFTNFSKNDTDGDGLIDWLEWEVPHLSNQTFEIAIGIFNAQSYPMVGGYWTVELDTNGTANFEVIPYDLTTFVNESVPMYNGQDDLEFEHFYCGEQLVTGLFVSTPETCTANVLDTDGTTPCYVENGTTFVNYTTLQSTSLSINITSFKIYNYSCDNYSYWTDTVRTPGEHHILFKFGNENATAHNWAVKNATSTTVNATVNIRRPSGTVIITGAYMSYNSTEENNTENQSTTWTYDYALDCQEEGQYEYYVELLSLGNSQNEKNRATFSEGITYWVDNCKIGGVGHVNCTVHAKSNHTESTWKVFGGRLELKNSSSDYSPCNITSVGGDYDAYWTEDGQNTCAGNNCGQWIEFYHNVSATDEDELTFVIMCDDGSDNNSNMQMQINETCGPSICGNATIASGGFRSCANPTCTDNFTFIGNDSVQSLGGFDLMTYDIGILDVRDWAVDDSGDYNINWDADSGDCDCYLGTGYYGIGGDIATCCGDDASEYKYTRNISGTMDDGYVNSTADDACCSNALACVAADTCYTNATDSVDPDGDGDNDYCLNGVWQDCNVDAQCDPGEFCSNTDCIVSGLNVSFITPTDGNNTKFSVGKSTTINVSTEENDGVNTSVIVDWNSTLVGWWRFENNFLDETDNNNDGTCTNCPTNSTGRYGKGMLFDGLDDQLTIPDSALWDFGTQDFTISFWYQKLDDDRGHALSFGEPSNNLEFDFDDSGISVWAYWMGGGAPYVRTATDYTDGEWHYLTFTRSGNDFTLYIDGSQIGQTTDSSSITVSDFTIGSINGLHYWNGSIDEVQVYHRALTPSEINASMNESVYPYTGTFYNLQEGDTYTIKAYAVDTAGQIADTGVYTYTVNNKPSTTTSLASTSGLNKTSDDLTLTVSSTDTDGDVLTNITDWRLNGTSIAVLNMPFDTNVSITSSGAIRDYSTYANNATLGNGTSASAPIWNASGQVGGAYTFDGINDYMEIAETNSLDFNESQVFAIEGWFKPKRLTNLPIITKKDGYAATNGGWSIFLDNTGANYYAAFNAGNGSNYVLIKPTAATHIITANNWFHFVTVVDRPNNQVTFYINGEKETVSLNMGSGSFANELPIRIGRQDSWYFNGTIDEIRVYNKTLTDAQVLENYQAGAAGYQVYTLKSSETAKGDNWTVAVTPNDAYDDGTTQVTNQVIIVNTEPTVSSASISSSSGNNATYDNLTVSIASTDNDTDAITNITDWRLNGKSIAVLNMPFDTNSSLNVKDYSTFDNNGTASGDPTWITNGTSGGAYTLDGDGDYISLGTSQIYNLTEQLTISTWLKTGDARNHQPIFSKMSDVNNGYYFRLRYGEPGFILGRGGTYNDMWATGTNVSDGTWHHVLVTYNGSSTNMYVDGTLAWGPSSFTGSSSVSTEARIGRGGSVYDVNDYFNGTLDEVLVFNRTLTAEQVSELYRAGAAGYQVKNISYTETSKNEVWSVAVTPNDGETDGPTTTAQISIGNTVPVVDSVVINATSLQNRTTDNITAYINTSDLDGDAITNITDWRVEGESIAIFKYPFNTNISTNTEGAIKSYTTSGLNATLGNISDSTRQPTWVTTGISGGAYQFDGSNDIIMLENEYVQGNVDWTVTMWVKTTDTSAGLFSNLRGGPVTNEFAIDNGVIFYRNYNGSWNTHNGTTNIADDAWHFLTWVNFNNNSMKVYVDGLEEISSFDSKTTNGGRVNVIGSSWARAFQGIMDEFTIYNVSLSPQQINETYSAGLSGKDIEIISYNDTRGGQNWTVAVTPNDGQDDGVTVTSNTLKIALNQAPTIDLNTPLNNTVLTQYSNRTPTFTWNATDADGDAMNFTIWVYEDASLTTLNFTNTTINATNYTHGLELDVDVPYWWIVEATDGTERTNSTIYNFTIESYQAIQLTTSTVDFGNLAPGDVADTENNATPLIVENLGNVFVNLTVYANTTLWLNEEINTSFFRFKADTSEVESFNEAASQMVWKNMDNVSINLLQELDYHFVNDTAQIDINITVPTQEPPGQKQSQIIVGVS